MRKRRTESLRIALWSVKFKGSGRQADVGEVTLPQIQWLENSKDGGLLLQRKKWLLLCLCVLTLSILPPQRAHAPKAREALLARWIFCGDTDPGWAGEPLKAHRSYFLLIQHAPVWARRSGSSALIGNSAERNLFFLFFTMPWDIKSTHALMTTPLTPTSAVCRRDSGSAQSTSADFQFHVERRAKLCSFHAQTSHFFANWEATTVSKCTAMCSWPRSLKTIGQQKRQRQPWHCSSFQLTSESTYKYSSVAHCAPVLSQLEYIFPVWALCTHKQQNQGLYQWSEHRQRVFFFIL